jgi:WD40 repeat protein/tetratricopeptide (TPR) repeat protein
MVHPYSGKLIIPDGDEARVWDIHSGRPLSPPFKHPAPITGATFSPDSRYIAIAFGRHVQVWDTLSAKPLCPLLEHSEKEIGKIYTPRGPITEFDEVKRTEFSSDGRLLLTCTAVEARAWDTLTGRALTPTLGYSNVGSYLRCFRACISPDGCYVLTRGNGRAAEVWDVAKRQLRYPPLDHEESLLLAKFSPNGHLLLTAGGLEARLWEASNGKLLCPPLRHDAEVCSACFSPDSKRILTASKDGTAWVRDAQSGRPISQLAIHGGAIERASFSPDSRLVITASQNTARVWDVESGQPLTLPLEHPVYDSVCHAGFLANGRSVITITLNEQGVRVWDLSADQRSVPDLLLLAQLLTGTRLDEVGGESRLDNEAISTAWKTLRNKFPKDFEPSPGSRTAWLRREATVCATFGDWTAALAHSDQLVKGEPARPANYLNWGEAHAARGHWAEAVGDFEKYEELAGTNEQVLNWHALALAGAQDRAGQRKVCAAILDKYRNDPSLANDVAWHCARFPDLVPDPGVPVALAETAVAQLHTSGNLNTLGVALYRAGRFQDAILKLDEGIKEHKQGGSASDWLFLAMAHKSLGHTEEAQKWLQKAIQWIDKDTEKGPAGIWGGISLTAWEYRLELQLTREEAEAVVHAGSSKASPFKKSGK